ncbi:MAG TPA: winged helix-turn-helix transcriptional regulator [Candidatus Thermoplasmatota archaeon]|nr:winged helix-turn-helix transcriptional regulator [Candidatus Thermoplasmatota archaeon]
MTPRLVAVEVPSPGKGQAKTASQEPPAGGQCGPAADGCLGDLFGLLSQTHMMQILGVLIWRSKGPVRFLELQDALGMSPNTLSHRLKALVQAGLVTRTAYSTIPPRVDYQATAKAHGLKRVFKALHEWASENTLEPERATA